MTHRTNGCLSNSPFGLLVVVMVLMLTVPTLRAQTPPITDVAFASDGKSVVSCSQQGLHVFSWPELHLQKTIKVSFPNLHCVVFSPDGKRLAVGGGTPAEEGAVEVFAWPECKSQMKLSKHDDSVVAVSWRGVNSLVAASLDRLLTQWNLQTGDLVTTYQGHSRGVSSACILKTGEMVTAGHDQSVRVWNSETGALMLSLNQHSKPINTMAVCPTSVGKPMVATAAEDRTIRFWQPTIGRMMRYVRLDSEPLDIAWMSKSKIVASCVDGQARVVDTDNVQVLRTIPAIKGWAYAVANHPHDGTFAIAGSDGQLLRIGLEESD